MPNRAWALHSNQRRTTSDIPPPSFPLSFPLPTPDGSDLPRPTLVLVLARYTVLSLALKQPLHPNEHENSHNKQPPTNRRIHFCARAISQIRTARPSSVAATPWLSSLLS